MATVGAQSHFARPHGSHAKLRKGRKAGASKIEPKKSGKDALKILTKLLAWLAAIVFFAAAALLVAWLEPQERLKTFTNRPVASVQIDGEFLYLSKEQAEATISGYIDDGFLKLDIGTLKEELEQNPWVDSVAVARQWPDVLKITINEQQPIARWGSEGFLNMRGDIVHVSDNSKLQALPLLYGNARYARQVMQQYLFIAKLIGATPMALTSVQLDETLSWTLEINNDLTVRLGRERVLEKLQNLVVATDGVLKDRFDEIHTVDMRYDNGFAVSWKDADDKAVVATAN